MKNKKTHVGNELKDTSKKDMLISKYKEDKYISKLIEKHYGCNIQVISKDSVIDFSPTGMDGIIYSRHLTYDEYLEIQFASASKWRYWFMVAREEAMYVGFKGKLGKKTVDKVCFGEIHVSGCYCDGTGFVGKEDHVWMDAKEFEDYEVGDCLKFGAEVYRYIKVSNGKQLDYGLRYPHDIEKIEAYAIPSDDELLMQAIDQFICETCIYEKHCYGVFCLRNEEELEKCRKEMFEAVKCTRKGEI